MNNTLTAFASLLSAPLTISLFGFLIHHSRTPPSLWSSVLEAAAPIEHRASSTSLSSAAC